MTTKPLKKTIVGCFWLSVIFPAVSASAWAFLQLPYAFFVSVGVGLAYYVCARKFIFNFCSQGQPVRLGMGFHCSSPQAHEPFGTISTRLEGAKGDESLDVPAYSRNKQERELRESGFAVLPCREEQITSPGKGGQLA